MKGGIVADRCDFCADLNFEEQTFCDLNRSVQNTEKFKCHAFRAQPRVRLSAVKDIEDSADNREPRSTALDEEALLCSTADIHPVLEEALRACEKEIGGFASMLWLAPEYSRLRRVRRGEVG